MDIEDQRRSEIEHEELMRLDAWSKENAAQNQRRDRSQLAKRLLVVGAIVVATVASVMLGARTQTNGTYDKIDFSIQCQNMISQQLKAPSTAQFQAGDKFGDGINSIKDTSSGFQWLGFVDAQNGFGAMVRTHFVCSHDRSSGSVKANVLN